MTFPTSLNTFFGFPFVQAPVVQALGWALLHFVWQGAILAAILYAANLLTRPSEARLRYAIGCMVMLLMPVVFVGTVVRSERSLAAAPPAQHSIAARPHASFPGRPAVTAPAGHRTTPPASRVAFLNRLILLRGRLVGGWLLRSWITCIWLAGVVALSIYSAAGWRRVQRIRHRGTEPADPVWIEAMEKLMRRLQISRPVRLYMSAVAEVPMVIGWIRPYILLPVSAVTGLDEAQLRAVLAHELAHIRRYDYLINLLQNAVETLLFYHPAVWWVSNRIRQERENCCDDLAVEVCGDAMVYAGALAELEELRGSIPAHRQSPALAATGGDLLARIRRLMDQGSETGRERISGSAGVAIAAAAVFAAFIWGLPAAGQPKEPQPQPVKPRPAKKQAFEVASVRLFNPNSTVNTNDPGFRNVTTVFPSNRLTMRFTNLQSLIREAYGVDYRYIFGGPDWLDRQHYDLDAKVEGSALLTREQMQPLLRNLLEERFHLRAHHAPKIVPGYALVVAKGGPRLQANKGAPFTGMQGGYILKFQNVSVADFAGYLTGPVNGSGPVKGPVIDRTGIKGMYDFDLKYGPHDPDDAVWAQIPKDLYANLPDIFTVLEEKYGLKLVPENVTMDTLVIDHVDKVPTEN
jgi:uncharacterized protein (TIGR03435 family)